MLRNRNVRACAHSHITRHCEKVGNLEYIKRHLSMINYSLRYRVDVLALSVSQSNDVAYSRHSEAQGNCRLNHLSVAPGIRSV